VDDRRVINGIFYVLRTGIPWADLPEQYGPPTTVYNRFNRWSYAGHWDRIMEAIADAHNVDMVMVDGTSVRQLRDREKETKGDSSIDAIMTQRT
jgi:transposase